MISLAILNSSFLLYIISLIRSLIDFVGLTFLVSNSLNTQIFLGVFSIFCNLIGKFLF